MILTEDNKKKSLKKRFVTRVRFPLQISRKFLEAGELFEFETISLRLSQQKRISQPGFL